MGAKSVHLLVIEDRAEDRTLYRRLLKRDGSTPYKIREAETGQKGLELARAVKFDCILLDYRLPDFDGLEFLTRLAASSGKRVFPIVLLTRTGKEGVGIQALKAGAQDYLVKSALTAESLRRAIHNAREKVALRRKIDKQRVKLELLAQDRASLLAQLQERFEILAESERRKDHFLSILAHELRNPLAALCNAIDVLREPNRDTPTVEWAQGVMERQSRRMVRLIGDLLDVSRLNQGKIELRKERLELAEIITRAVETARPFVDERHHQLSVSLPAKPVCVEADPVRIEQVLVNLLNNAARFMEPGGHIELKAVGSGPDVFLCVKDKGMGIPPEMLERIFEVFTQVNRSLASASQWGLGIGLTLVRSLVELHGGGVWASSAGSGMGSEFVVRLPILIESSHTVAVQETAVISSSAALPPPVTGSVLVVDDNEDLAEGFALLLRTWGYVVDVARDGPSALTAALERPPALVLLDIGLPGLDGYEVAQRLRARPGLEQARLVALTGYGQEEDRSRARAAGFDYHLTKPVEPDDLRQLLARFLPHPFPTPQPDAAT
jgi:signal transduction histidine kinase